MIFDTALPVTDEFTEILQHEIQDIIVEVKSERPDIDNEELAQIGKDRLTERVELFQRVERFIR